MVCIQKRKVLWNFKLYNGNVSSIHKNTKKDRGTKNEFHWRIFCKTLIRQHSCTTHCVQTVPVLAAILQKILWNSIISYLYLSLYFYEYLKTFSYKIKNFQTERCVCWTLLVFDFCSGRQIFIINTNNVKHTDHLKFSNLVIVHTLDFRYMIKNK